MYKSTYLFSLSNVFKLKKEKQSKQTQYTIFYIKLIKLKQGKRKKKIENANLAIQVTGLHVPAWGGEQAAVESKKNKNVNREEKSGVCVWRRKGKREKEKRNKKRKKERRI